MFLRFIVTFCFCTFFHFSALGAVATPSDPLPQVSKLQQETENFFTRLLKEFDFDDLDEIEKTELLYDYLNSFSGPNYATNSDARALSDISSDIRSIKDYLIPIEDTATSSDIAFFSGSEIDDIAPFSVTGDFNIDRNVLVYYGRFNNRTAVLCLPASYDGQIWIDDQNRLFNVGTGNVVGRLFYGDFSASDYNYNMFTVGSVLANTANTIYTNGSLSYNRAYSVSGGRLVSADTYGTFYVTDVVRTSQDSANERTAMYLLIIIFLGGVGALCSFKQSRR